MNKNKQYKIALVLYTAGLDYDDRIRKEILTIQKLYSNVSFKIFAVEPKNREEEGVTSYGVPYRVPYLKSRDKYTSASHTIAKAWDFYKTVKDDLKSFDAVWCADEQTLFFTLLIHGKPMIWDLHELPLMLIGSWWKQSLFRFAERKLRVVVHANEPRLNHLKEIGMVRCPDKHFVLRNYPAFNEIDSDYDDLYENFVKWLGNDKCVYLQGILGEERADWQSIGAVLAIPNLKAVVVGEIPMERKAVFEQMYGKEELKKRVFFTGMVKQLKTPQYIQKCITALVFYRKTEMNNWYCEANRFYQNVINGNPVVCGSNPPMRELVEKYGFGISIEDDGSSVEKIAEGLRRILANLDVYKKNIEENKNKLYWNSQEVVHRQIIEKLFA